MTVEVTHDAEKHQFAANIDDNVGSLKYNIIDSTVWEYYSTYVPPNLRGKGVAQALAKYALSYARDNNLKIKPTCSFIKTYIDGHPEYRSLLL